LSFFFVLEGAVQLLLVIGESLFLSLDLVMLFLRKPVQCAQRMLDALYRAHRIFHIEVSAVGVFAPDEQVGEFVFAIEALACVPSTHDFESAVVGAVCQAQVIAP
jgi:hypothetical protein